MTEDIQASNDVFTMSCPLFSQIPILTRSTHEDRVIVQLYRTHSTSCRLPNLGGDDQTGRRFVSTLRYYGSQEPQVNRCMARLVVPTLVNWH